MGKAIAAKLKETLPQQLFEIAVQAKVGSKVLARENIKALRKDVLAKCVSSSFLCYYHVNLTILRGNWYLSKVLF